MARPANAREKAPLKERGKIGITVFMNVPVGWSKNAKIELQINKNKRKKLCFI
jgi:hypothetical protein